MRYQNWLRPAYCRDEAQSNFTKQQDKRDKERLLISSCRRYEGWLPTLAGRHYIALFKNPEYHSAPSTYRHVTARVSASVRLNNDVTLARHFIGIIAVNPALLNIEPQCCAMCMPSVIPPA